MHISISNIAWGVELDDEVSKLLQNFEVSFIDIAPAKYFPSISSTTDSDIKSVREWWFDRGIKIHGMQSLMFGTSGLNLFGVLSVRENMLAHLRHVLRIAAGLGVKSVTFGSPKNRDRSGLGDEEVICLAVSFFRDLGDLANDYGVDVCLEPNPEVYGANFMTNIVDTVAIVKLVDHERIRLQLDTGAVILNNENFAEVLDGCSNLVGHIHLSEAHLRPLDIESEINHRLVSKLLRAYFPGSVATIEMLTLEGFELEGIRGALNVVTEYYGAQF